ncbi:hypothetical protein BS329_25915 [Amycolatopsis coloradensis]|uniref:DUF3631 domain-containing protein n=1 Tax=Amycolatopsis coloradensis TaxID=76021 RepID=A0A1R0KL19_9PSEU|nr:hypothetical protein BS329_25915 [Amycolatopsis coloradensis]
MASGSPDFSAAHSKRSVEEDVERESAPVRGELEAWMSRVGDEVSRARPERPDGVRDRAAEI